MGPVERFTRDAASKYVWALSMLVAILGLVFTFARGGDAVEEERLASQRRAVAAVAQVVEPRVDASDLDAPITEPELTSLREAVDRTILSDPRVVRLRIWSEDGRLWFSTDRGETLGSEGAFNDEILNQVAEGRTITRSNLSDTGSSDEGELGLLRTYTPLGSVVVVEIDQTSEGTIAPVEATWRRYQILAGALLVLFLLLTILALRDPIERINTGVAFAPSSIPAGYSLIDDERLNAVEEVYRLSHDRVARLEEKLAESEAMRRRLEGDIQRTLTKAATGAATRPPDTRPAVSTPPAESAPPIVAPPAPERPRAPARPAAAAPAAATPKSSTNGDAKRVIKPPQRPPAEKRPAEPEIVALPESDLVGETRPAAPGGPLARATREDPSHPEFRPKSEPEKTKPKPKPKRVPRLKRKSERASEPVVPPAAITPVEPVAPVEPIAPAAPAAPVAPTAPVVIPPAEPEKPRRASRLTRKPDPIPAASAPTPAPRTTTEIDDARAHEAALETFIRLTESDRQHAESAEVDQGAIRAALARTAARKKPGGHRLQPHDPPGESQGGPPRRS
jgi:hypothetical protein